MDIFDGTWTIQDLEDFLSEETSLRDWITDYIVVDSGNQLTTDEAYDRFIAFFRVLFYYYSNGYSSEVELIAAEEEAARIEAERIEAEREAFVAGEVPIPEWPDMDIEAPELGPDAVLDRLRAAGARDLDVGEVFRLEEP